MVCKKCGSDNVQKQAITETKQHGRGFFMSLIHIVLAICTCGLWLLVPLLHKNKIKSKVKYKCICQNCGNTWNG